MPALPLSDDDWSSISHLFPQDMVPRLGRPRRPAREVLDAALWVIVNGEKWHRLPTSFPPAQTCYIKYLKWRKWGIMDEVLSTLGITAPSPDSPGT